MSILIQGISLPPKDANPITLMIFHDGSIWHYDDETDFKAIELPPHGRFSIYDGVIVQNDAEPTIIPADPEGGADG